MDFFSDQTLCMISRQEGTQRNTSIENYQKRFITKFVTNILIFLEFYLWIHLNFLATLR